LRDVTEEDIVRLTEIRIKRISKFNSFKANEEIAKTNEELLQTKHHLEHLTDYAIAYFENLLSKHGKGRERARKSPLSTPSGFGGGGQQRQIVCQPRRRVSSAWV
jgi:hypothetical protein